MESEALVEGLFPAVKTVSILTLGCKLNQAESESLALSLRDTGYRVLNSEAPADVYVVNTCTVTQVADQKSRQLIRRLHRISPDARILVVGCYAERAPGEIDKAESIDTVVGSEAKRSLVKVIERMAPLPSIGPLQRTTCAGRSGLGRIRSLVKVGDGCNKSCSYCIVPLARGRERSEPLVSILEAVRRRVDSGCLEIVLTSVNLGRWGVDLGFSEGLGLSHLVSEILDKTDVRRLRLTSVEPEDLREETIIQLRHHRVCRHLHLPLQSGCNTVLKRMRRRYDLDKFSALVDSLRLNIPEIALTTDVIVGFPGETEKEFEQSLAFVAKVRFAKVHVFRYSPRQGTEAATMPDQVPSVVKYRRASELAALAEESARQYRRCFLGRQMEVLYEQRVASDTVPAYRDHLSVWRGLTDNYLRVYSPSYQDLAGRLIPTMMKREHESGLWGEIVPAAGR